MVSAVNIAVIVLPLLLSHYQPAYQPGPDKYFYAVYLQDSSKQHPGFRERVEEREKMVSRDIEGYPYNPVSDIGVLNALRVVPRHLFVPESLSDLAYKNSPLPIGFNQTISQPYIVASMTELLDLQGDEKVLEIGTGSGYQAAVLAEICQQVFTIEIISELGMQAQKVLKELGYKNINIRIGDGYEGWPEEAPFDRIIVTCAPTNIPKPLIDQLRPGGMIVIPVGKAHEVQKLVVVVKTKNGKVYEREQYPVRFVPMTGKSEED